MEIDQSSVLDTALQRHRDEIVVHLNTLLEKFDVVLQKRLQVYNIPNLGLESELSNLGIFDEKAEYINETKSSMDGSCERAQDAETSSKEISIAESPQRSPGRSPGLVENSDDVPKQSPSRSLGRSKSYESALKEESRLQYGWANIFSDLDVTAGTRSKIRAGCANLQRVAARMVGSTWFNLVFAVVIITNSLYLGAQVEINARYEGIFIHPVLLAMHVVYMGLFSVEIFIRCAAVGPVAYVCGSGWAWHWLDMVAVISSWVEMAVSLLDKSGQFSSAASNFRILRIFRITRLVKVLRSLSLVRFIGALRTLVHSIADTLKPLVWALLLLLLIEYAFSVLFTDAALDYIYENTMDEGAELLDKYYGSVYKSTETLFRALLGGLDWSVPADALLPLGIFWVQLFHWYIAFCSFAVLNVMTGVFCHSAIMAAEHDHQKLIENRKRFKTLLEDVFLKMDPKGHEVITITQFEKIFADEDMRAFFEAIEIDAVDAWTLFESLDADGDFVISKTEFVERCMQLHGAARSVDLYALKQQSHKLREQMDEIEAVSRKLTAAVQGVVYLTRQDTGQFQDPAGKPNNETFNV